MMALEQYLLYNDLVGDVVADLAKQPSTHDSYLQYFAEKFNINSDRFKIVGIELYGVKDPTLHLICQDLLKTKNNIPFISKIEIPAERFDIEEILEGLHIVLYENFDEKYKNLNINEVIRIEDLLNH